MCCEFKSPCRQEEGSQKVYFLSHTTGYHESIQQPPPLKKKKNTNPLNPLQQIIGTHAYKSTNIYVPLVSDKNHTSVSNLLSAESRNGTFQTGILFTERSTVFRRSSKGFAPTFGDEFFCPAQVLDSWHPAGVSYEERRKSIPLFHLSSSFTNPCINKRDNHLRPQPCLTLPPWVAFSEDQKRMARIFFSLLSMSNWSEADRRILFLLSTSPPPPQP